MISTFAQVKAVPTLVPAVCKTTANGTGVGVDRLGFGDVMMIAQQGISGDTLSGSIYWVITFEESDTLGSGYTTIAAGDLEGGTGTHTIDAAAEDPTQITRNYRGVKRYVRIVWSQTGTHTNGTPLAGVVLLGNPNQIPPGQLAELGTDS